MPKTNIKITILLIISLLAGQFAAFSAYASEITPESVVYLVNQERKEVGLEALVKNEILDKAAMDKAEDMLAKNYFAHTSPDGTTPWHWFEKEGYDYEFAGENLAINFTTAEEQNEKWMESPTHKKNILSQKFNEIGVAVVKGVVEGRETIVTVQEFGYKNGLPTVAGETSSVSLEEAVSMPVGEVAVLESEKFQKKDKFLANFILIVRGSDYVRIMKSSVAISIFVLMVIIFSSFTSRLSKLSESLKEMKKRFFKDKMEDFDLHSEEHRIAIKFFPLDMKKIEVTNLHHMKQRE